MVSSALNYANRLKKNNNKGPLGQMELFDTSVQVNKKTKKLFELMNDSTNTIVHTGAGVSTGSGIPDFRGPSGIWTLMDNRSSNNSRRIKDNNNFKNPKRRKMTDANCIPTRDISNKNNNNINNNSNNSNNEENEDTEYKISEKEEINEEEDADKTVEEVNDKEEFVLYGNNRKKAVEFILALPSETHLCLLELLNKGIVKFIITQNIDGLHSLSGIPFDKLSELHGNVFVQRCLGCARRFQRSYVAPTISFQSTGDLCGVCSFPPFNLLTDVVLDWFDCYEEHFEENSMKKAQLADFHLVLGSSLHIEPACHYASDEYYRNPQSPLAIVNYQSTKLDPECDLIIHEDVNKICNILLKKFQLTIPTFVRKSYMIILKYQLRNNYCVLLMKLSCIIEVELINKFGSNINSSYNNNNTNSNSDNNKNGNSNSDNVKLECINKLQGIYKFTFSRKFKLRLKLFYNTQLELEVPYERIVLFKGEIWELDLCATNGSKVKLSPKTFNSKCCKFCNNTGSSSNEDGYNGDSINGYGVDGYNNNKNSNCNNDDISNNNNTTNNNSNKFVDNESIMIDGLIHINKMTISYNSHLIENTPYRLVGYLDIINKKSEEFQEFKLPNSLIILSYLWASNSIQNVDEYQHQSEIIKEYLEESKKFSKLIFSYSYNREEYIFHLLDGDNNYKKKRYKKMINRYLDEVLKKQIKVKNENEDILEGYYDKYISKTYTTNKNGTRSTKDKDNTNNSNNNRNKKEKDHKIKKEYEDDKGDNNDNSSSNEDGYNGDTDNKDNESNSNNNYNNESNTNDSDIDSRRHIDKNERVGRITNSTTKRKDEIWNEITECNKFAEMIINKSLKRNLIKIKYSKVTPKIENLNLESYLMTLQSSLPLKLFISKNAKLGYLVKEVPQDLVESNKTGNYKNYHRIFRYYDLPKILHVIEEIQHDKENDLRYILGNKGLFRNLGANLYELLVYNVIKMSYDLDDLGNYIIIKLFCKQLPLWILKYLSDFFECR